MTECFLNKELVIIKRMAELKRYFSKKNIYFSLLVISILINIFFIYQNFFNNKDKFPFLNEGIAQLELEEFLEQQKRLSVSYVDLRRSVESILENEGGNYSFYFEDLVSGAWIGINEKAKFYPASLIKVSIFVAILKKIELGELQFDEVLKIEKEDLNSNSGVLYSRGEGFMDVEELLYYLIAESDNTALNVLKKKITSIDLIEAIFAMGQTYIDVSDPKVMTSAKEYVNIFRSLYFSNYLKRHYSNFALDTLSKTKYKEGIPAGVPEDVIVAHKIGTLIEEGNYHDCGIVYAHKKPYLLCIMARTNSKEEAYKTIMSISKTVYNYVEQN